MKIIGLTGGIGTGKSTVSAYHAQKGCKNIDADLISHQMTEAGSPCLAEIKDAFGEDVFLRDGNLDRKKVGRLVFAGATKKKRHTRRFFFNMSAIFSAVGVLFLSARHRCPVSTNGNICMPAQCFASRQFHRRSNPPCSAVPSCSHPVLPNAEIQSSFPNSPDGRCFHRCTPSSCIPSHRRPVPAVFSPRSFSDVCFLIFRHHPLPHPSVCGIVRPDLYASYVRSPATHF